MAALFPRSANTAFAVALVLIVAGVATAVAAPMVYVRTPYFTKQAEPVVQPVVFDHRHHVADDGIDCRYCHQTVEVSATAGLPSVSTCMNCHSQVWNRSSYLDPVRSAYFADRPIEWRRVNDLPDFVYFNHAIHVSKGVGCVTCHGRVDRMAAVAQAASLTMGFCLDCHRRPEAELRPREEVTSTTWEFVGDRLALGQQLAEEYDVHPRQSCTTCHR